MEKETLSNTVVIKLKYPFRTIVYWVTDIDQKPRMVTGVLLMDSGTTQYRITCGNVIEWALECEISDEQNIALKSGN